MGTLTVGTLEINDVVTRLLDLPAEIAAAEGTLMRFDEERRKAEGALTEASDRLLLDGSIDGRNEALRAAQLRQALISVQGDLDMAERLVVSAKLQLHRLQAEHSSLRAIARIFGAMGD